MKTGFGLDLIGSDGDLDAIRDDPEFKRLVADAATLAHTRKR